MTQRGTILDILSLMLACLALAMATAPPARAATSGARLWAKTIPQVITAQADHVLFVKPAPKGGVYAGGVYLEPLASGYLFVARYASSGRQLWLRKYGKAQHIDANAAATAVDTKGNLIVAGQATHGTDVRVLLLKYSPAGTLLWHREWNGPIADGYDAATCVTSDTAGNILVGGIVTRMSTGEDYLALKYDPAGHRKWVYAASGSGVTPNDADEVLAIAADGHKNVFITGSTTNAAVDSDCITIKLTPAGHDGWTPFYRTFTGSGGGNDLGIKIAVAAGRVYVLASAFDGAAGDDVALVQYTLGGAAGPSTVSDFGNKRDVPQDLAVDPSGAAWVCGFTEGGPLPQTGFVIRYNANGTFAGDSLYAPASAADTAFAAIAGNGRGTAWAVGNKATLPSSGEALVLVKYHGAAAQAWDKPYAGSQNAAGGECVTFSSASSSVFAGGWQVRFSGLTLDPLLARYVR
jgi:hypothetical protein